MSDQFFCQRCGDPLDLTELLSYDLSEIDDDHFCTTCEEELWDEWSEEGDDAA